MLPLVTSGALAAFTFVPIGKYIKIVVADPTAHDGLVQIVVKPHQIGRAHV